VQALEVVDIWRALPLVVLGWLAYFFGRTLLSGRVPLIERIARVRDPDLPPPLRRYTRRLTAVWCAYFLFAALLASMAAWPPWWTSALIWAGAVILFVGEHSFRKRLFPDRSFPKLAEQLQDTVKVWRRAP
jgi:uncharacterized membrane protein